LREVRAHFLSHCHIGLETGGMTPIRPEECEYGTRK
jgi:hypothetical protein